MGGFARCPGMHTVSIYCDRRWFCRPPVMRPLWRGYSKKDPALVPTAASSPSSSVSRFVDLRARKRTAVFCVTRIRGFHTGILARLSLRELLAAARRLSPKPECIGFEIRPALMARDIPDNARSIKRIRCKLLA